MLRLVTCDRELQQLAQEAAGDCGGSSVVTFRIVGNYCGRSLFREAETGDATALELIDIILDYCALAAAVPQSCLLCRGPFTAPIEEVWALLLVHAAIPEPTLTCCSPLCTACCASMNIETLRHATLAVWRTVFPELKPVAISPEAGHA